MKDTDKLFTEEEVREIDRLMAVADAAQPLNSGEMPNHRFESILIDIVQRRVRFNIPKWKWLRDKLGIMLALAFCAGIQYINYIASELRSEDAIEIEEDK